MPKHGLIRLRTGRLLAGLGLLAVTLVATEANTPGDDRIAPTPTAMSGGFSLQSSKPGLAIFSAGNLAPGRSAEGDLTLTNSGDSPGSLSVDRTDTRDAPGIHGGMLSQQLDLEVREVTSTAAPRPVFTGKLGAMPPLTAGTLQPGESRSYRFVVTLPEGGIPTAPSGGDNAFAGASVNVDYRWTLTGTQPGSQPAPASPGRPPVLRLRLGIGLVRPHKILRERRLVMRVQCSRACRVGGRVHLLRARSRRELVLRVRGRRLPAAAWRRITVRLPSTTVTALRRALRSGQRPRIRVTLRARDRHGHTTVIRRRIVFAATRR